MTLKNFALRLTIRVMALAAVIGALVYTLLATGYAVISLLLGILAALLLSDIVRRLGRTNRELTRFLDSIRYADFGQRFQMPQAGSGFEELGEVFTEIVRRFQILRNDQEESLRYLKALMEHVPVPLLSLNQDEKITLHNNAARRLFGSARIERLADLSSFGNDFKSQVSAVAPGDRRLAVFRADEAEQRFTVAATEIAIGNRVERLISLQNIQSELDGAQLQAWQDLVRVLTHEIMNSITPISSLAKTASEITRDTREKADAYPDVLDDLDDVKSAVDTVARRSDGLMSFVQSYRQLTRLPPPKREWLRVKELFDRIVQLRVDDWATAGIDWTVEVAPTSLGLEADAQMLEQTLLNLLKNAEQAVREERSPRVWLRAFLNPRGHINIEVSDNGPGIKEDIANKIFVPFFTTKKEGSGVGLALTRQIMLAHGGLATAGQSDAGGARVTLTF
ncbi:MAG: ATP-binding protein [Pseudomonadota bacterium]